MKHIKFQARAIGPDFSKVEVQILEQTHRGAYFGMDKTRSFYRNGFGIESVYSPANEGGEKIYVRGSIFALDNNKIIMSVEKYQKFKATVEAYNEYFKAKPATAPSACSFIVG